MPNFLNTSTLNILSCSNIRFQKWPSDAQLCPPVCPSARIKSVTPVCLTISPSPRPGLREPCETPAWRERSCDLRQPCGHVRRGAHGGLEEIPDCRKGLSPIPTSWFCLLGKPLHTMPATSSPGSIRNVFCAFKHISHVLDISNSCTL